MKNLLLTFAILLPISAHASPWSGKLDLVTLPSIGAWQSLTSTDQAIGVSKRFFHLDYSAQPLINVSLFGGGMKPMLSEPSAPVRFLAGDVISVPGSTLDWALGTKWGDKWIPNLKTGILFAHDVSRLSKTHLFGDFQGIGAMWPFGGTAK